MGTVMFTGTENITKALFHDHSKGQVRASSRVITRHHMSAHVVTSDYRAATDQL